MGGQLDKKVTARRLGDLTQDPALAPRAEQLRALAEALDSADDDALDAWAELDLIGHFARPESIAEPVSDSRGTRFDAYLDWILGALVFLPLLFTWAGLWRASSAYDALTGADPEAAGRPFLQLWQSGFQGQLGEVFRFGHVAIGGCVALLMLFVLTAVHGYRRTATDRREEQAQQRARGALARLVPVLTRAQLSLNEHRFASPQRFAAELNSAAGRIQRMHSKAITTQEHLFRAAELVGVAADKVGAAVDKVEQRLAEAETYVRPLEKVIVQLEESVRDSGTAIRTAVQSLDEPLQQAGRQLVGAVDGQSDVLGKALENLRAAVQGLDEPVQQAGRQLAGAVDGQSDVLGKALDDLQTAGTGMRDLLASTADRLQTTVSGNSDSVRDALSDAAQRVEESLAVLAASQRGFTTGVEVVADLNGRLMDDLNAVAERTGEAADVSRAAVLGLDARSKALDEAAGRFTSVADAMERAVRETETARAGAEAAQRRAEDALQRADEQREELLLQVSEQQQALRQAEQQREELLHRAAEQQQILRQAEKHREELLRQAKEQQESLRRVDEQQETLRRVEERQAAVGSDL